MQHSEFDIEYKPNARLDLQRYVALAVFTLMTWTCVQTATAEAFDQPLNPTVATTACFESLARLDASSTALKLCNPALTSANVSDLVRGQLYSALAWYHAQSQRDEDAANAQSNISPLVTNDPFILNNLGNIHLVRGQYELAVSRYQQAITAQTSAQSTSTQPIQTALLHLNLAHALRGLGRYGQASEAFQNYLAYADVTHAESR